MAAKPTRPMKRLLIFALSLVDLSLHAEEGRFSVSAFSFARPEHWKQIEPKSPMRKAQFEIPGKDGGKPAEVTFFFFGGGQGGDVQANVSRWLAQFSGGKDVQKVEPQEFGGLKVTLVSTEGTMKASPFAGIPEDQPGFALLGAIIEHGDGPVFAKMTGPSALVKDSRESFVGMVKSARGRK